MHDAKHEQRFSTNGAVQTESFKRTDSNEQLSRESDKHRSDDSEHATVTLGKSPLAPRMNSTA